MDLPPALVALLERVHGADALLHFAVPPAYLLALARAPFPDGVYAPADALAWTEAGYEQHAFTEYEDEAALNRANLVDAGLWLHVGSSPTNRHDQFLCCDRRRAEYGQVYDLNDGHPAFGVVPDIIWPSFADYLAALR